FRDQLDVQARVLEVALLLGDEERGVVRVRREHEADGGQFGVLPGPLVRAGGSAARCERERGGGDGRGREEAAGRSHALSRVRRRAGRTIGYRFPSCVTVGWWDGASH